MCLNFELSNSFLVSFESGSEMYNHVFFKVIMITIMIKIMIIKKFQFNRLDRKLIYISFKKQKK